jgi:hypothetical protein
LIEVMNYMLPKHASDGAMGHIFDSYLACDELWSPGENLRTGWLDRRNKMIWSGELHYDVNPWDDFREIAMTITQMPATKAAAERLFSILQCAFKTDRASALLDILEAPLAIRMWQVYHAPDGVGTTASLVLRAQRNPWISPCCDGDSPGELVGIRLDRARLRLLTERVIQPCRGR